MLLEIVQFVRANEFPILVASGYFGLVLFLAGYMLKKHRIKRLLLAGDDPELTPKEKQLPFCLQVAGFIIMAAQCLAVLCGGYYDSFMAGFFG